MWKLNQNAQISAENRRLERDKGLREAQSIAERAREDRTRQFDLLKDMAAAGNELPPEMLAGLPEGTAIALSEMAAQAQVGDLSESGELASGGTSAQKTAFSRSLLNSPTISPGVFDLTDPGGPTQQAPILDPRRLNQLGRQMESRKAATALDLKIKGRKTAQTTRIQRVSAEDKEATENLGLLQAHGVLSPDDERVAREIDVAQNRVRANNSPGEAARILALADGYTEAFLVKEFATSLTPEGRDPQSRTIDAMVAANKFEQGTGPEPSENQWGYLMLSNRAYTDQRTGEFVYTGGTKDAAKQRDTRRSVYELGLRARELVDTYLDVVENPARTGAVIGDPLGQELLRLFGEENPFAAAYGVQMREYISILLKARQGSRPSDWDFKMYLTLIPSLTETRSASGIARLNQSLKSLDLYERSLNTPSFQRRSEAHKKAYPDTVLDRQVERAAEAVGRAQEAGDVRAEARHIKKFMELQEQLVKSGRADKVSMYDRGPVDDATAAEQAEVDQLPMFQGAP